MKGKEHLLGEARVQVDSFVVEAAQVLQDELEDAFEALHIVLEGKDGVEVEGTLNAVVGHPLRRRVGAFFFLPLGLVLLH